MSAEGSAHLPAKRPTCGEHVCAPVTRSVGPVQVSEGKALARWDRALSTCGIHKAKRHVTPLRVLSCIWAGASTGQALTRFSSTEQSADQSTSLCQPVRSQASMGGRYLDRYMKPSRLLRQAALTVMCAQQSTEPFESIYGRAHVARTYACHVWQYNVMVERYPPTLTGLFAPTTPGSHQET